MSEAPDQLSLPGSVTIRWRSGLLGFLVPVLGAVAIVIAIAAFDPDVAAGLAEERKGDLFALLRLMTLGPVNIPLLLVALWMSWLAACFGWRVFDGVAATADEAGLSVHPSTFVGSFAWRDVAGVSCVQAGRAPALLIRLSDGRQKTIRAVSDEGGQVDRFVAFARAQIARIEAEAG